GTCRAAVPRRGLEGHQLDMDDDGRGRRQVVRGDLDAVLPGTHAALSLTWVWIFTALGVSASSSATTGRPGTAKPGHLPHLRADPAVVARRPRADLLAYSPSTSSLETHQVVSSSLFRVRYPALMPSLPCSTTPRKPGSV